MLIVLRKSSLVRNAVAWVGCEMNRTGARRDRGWRPLHPRMDSGLSWGGLFSLLDEVIVDGVLENFGGQLGAVVLSLGKALH